MRVGQSLAPEGLKGLYCTCVLQLFVKIYTKLHQLNRALFTAPAVGLTAAVSC